MAAGAGGIGPGAGVSMTAGQGVTNGVETTLTGAAMTTMIPLASVAVKATAGKATVQGSVGVNVTTTGQLALKGTYVKVSVMGSSGGVLTDGCIDSLTGSSFLSGGTIGTPTFRVG